MSYLTREQRGIVREIVAGSYRSGLKGRERRKARNTGLATGLVESHLQNLKGGDRDSAGWRQERKQYYKDPTNVRNAVDRFYAEYKADAPKGGSISQRAQAVQQSAFPARYGEVAGEARRLGKLFDKGGSGPARRSGASRRPSYIEGRDDFDAKSFILDNLIGKPVKGRLKNSGTSAFLKELANPDSVYRTHTPGDLSAGKVGKKKGAEGVLSDKVKGELGKLVGHQSDRAGVATDPRTLKFARRVAGEYGKPITLGTGTAHSQMTSSGNVSQHWSGDALDLPASGSELTRMGRAALRAAGMSAKQARKAKGGIYNVGGRQIIFNTDDHWDHLHVGR